MEDLIPIIVFVIFAAVSILGKRRKTGSSGSQDDRSSLMNIVLENLKKHAAQQTAETDRGETGYTTREMPGWDQDEVVFSEDQDPDEDEWLPDVPEPPAKLTSRSGKSQEKPSRQQVDGISDCPGGIELKRSTILGPKSCSDLRRAIVWSEILGPPVALRNSSRHWRRGSEGKPGTA